MGFWRYWSAAVLSAFRDTRAAIVTDPLPTLILGAIPAAGVAVWDAIGSDLNLSQLGRTVLIFVAFWAVTFVIAFLVRLGGTPHRLDASLRVERATAQSCSGRAAKLRSPTQGGTGKHPAPP